MPTISSAFKYFFQPAEFKKLSSGKKWAVAIVSLLPGITIVGLISSPFICRAMIKRLADKKISSSSSSSSDTTVHTTRAVASNTGLTGKPKSGMNKTDKKGTKEESKPDPDSDSDESSSSHTESKHTKSGHSDAGSDHKGSSHAGSRHTKSKHSGSGLGQGSSHTDSKHTKSGHSDAGSSHKDSSNAGSGQNKHSKSRSRSPSRAESSSSSSSKSEHNSSSHASSGQSEHSKNPSRSLSSSSESSSSSSSSSKKSDFIETLKESDRFITLEQEFFDDTLEAGSYVVSVQHASEDYLVIYKREDGTVKTKSVSKENLTEEFIENWISKIEAEAKRPPESDYIIALRAANKILHEKAADIDSQVDKLENGSFLLVESKDSDGFEIVYRTKEGSFVRKNFKNNDILEDNIAIFIQACEEETEVLEANAKYISFLEKDDKIVDPSKAFYVPKPGEFFLTKKDKGIYRLAYHTESGQYCGKDIDSNRDKIEERIQSLINKWEHKYPYVPVELQTHSTLPAVQSAAPIPTPSANILEEELRELEEAGLTIYDPKDDIEESRLLKREGDLILKRNADGTASLSYYKNSNIMTGIRFYKGESILRALQMLKLWPRANNATDDSSPASTLPKELQDEISKLSDIIVEKDAKIIDLRIRKYWLRKTDEEGIFQLEYHGSDFQVRRKKRACIALNMREKIEKAIAKIETQIEAESSKPFGLNTSQVAQTTVASNPPTSKTSSHVPLSSLDSNPPASEVFDMTKTIRFPEDFAKFTSQMPKESGLAASQMLDPSEIPSEDQILDPSVTAGDLLASNFFSSETIPLTASTATETKNLTASVRQKKRSRKSKKTKPSQTQTPVQAQPKSQPKVRSAQPKVENPQLTAFADKFAELKKKKQEEALEKIKDKVYQTSDLPQLENGQYAIEKQTDGELILRYKNSKGNEFKDFLRSEKIMRTIDHLIKEWEK